MVTSEELISNSRVRVDESFCDSGRRKFYVKGFCYGPFAQNSR